MCFQLYWNEFKFFHNFFFQGTQDFILCRNGHCQYISKEDVENIPETQKDKKLFEDTFNIKIQDKIEAEVALAPVPPPPPRPPAPVLRGRIEAIALEQPPKDVRGPQEAAVEVATIALTEEANAPVRTFSVPDDPLPEFLIRPSSINLKDFQVSTG